MSTTPSSLSIIAASGDTDLLDRSAAIAASLGAYDPDNAVQALRRKLVCVPIDTEGNTAASVYEYAVAARQQQLDARAAAIKAAEDAHPLPPSPGANPAAVTDDYLRTVIQKLIDDGLIQAPPEATNN